MPTSRQGSLPGLRQALRVPLWTSVSPVCSSAVAPSSGSITHDPEATNSTSTVSEVWKPGGPLRRRARLRRVRSSLA